MRGGNSSSEEQRGHGARIRWARLGQQSVDRDCCCWRQLRLTMAILAIVVVG